MEMADTDLLESVEQFVNDENKIVSYEFLSQTCGVHVNLAKNVLEKFVDKLKSKKGGSIDDYEVVYSVGGFLGKNLSLLLVTGATLEEAKSKFDKVLYSHVYSVQKGKLSSFSLLYESNKTELKQTVQQCTGHSSIFCPSAKLKTAEELAANKPKPEPAAPKKAPDAAPLKSKPEPLKEANEINNQQQQNVPPAETIKKAPATAKPPTMATFFAKHHVKDPENKKKVEEAKKKEEESKKQNNKSVKRVVREPSDDEDEEDMEVDDAVDQKKVTNGSSKRFKLAEEEKPVVKAPAKSSKVTTSKTKRGKKESPKSKPQRKRIQHISDSSDEGEDDDDDVMVSSPEMAIQPAPELEEEDEDILEATIVEETKSQKNKGRKLVSKTVMDDDGFVVTTKEYVPCDVEEEEAPAVKEGEKDVPSVKSEAAPAAAKAAKRPSPPAKGKQQSIKSFFTRK